MNKVFRNTGIVLALVSTLTLAGCTKEATDVNRNLAKDADNFRVVRKVSFVNGITDKVLLEIQGYCSVDLSNPNRTGVTCKTDDGRYVKHLLGRADNVFPVVEQLEATDTSTSHYRFVLRPGSLIPEVTVHNP